MFPVRATCPGGQALASNLVSIMSSPKQGRLGGRGGGMAAKGGVLATGPAARGAYRVLLRAISASERLLPGRPPPERGARAA